MRVTALNRSYWPPYDGAMSIWGKARSFAVRDVDEDLEPGRELTARAVVHVVAGLVIIAGVLIFSDYRSPELSQVLWCLLGIWSVSKGIYEFSR